MGPTDIDPELADALGYGGSDPSRPLIGNSPAPSLVAFTISVTKPLLPIIAEQAPIFTTSRAGHPKLIVPQMVRTGAVVIDVGINRLPNGKLVGDVDFESAKQVAGAITPMPGGTGPMTVIALLQNVLKAARLQDTEVALK